MRRLSLKEQILSLIFLLLLQLPLIHRITVFDKAFGFFYVGYLLLLPVSISRSYLMIIGFIAGLVVDIFSNTPGIHSAACVAIMFLRNFWLSILYDDWRELPSPNTASLKPVKFLGYIFPLIFVHHLILFVVEKGGFNLFIDVLERVFFSAIFSGLIVFVVVYLINGSNRGD